MDESRQTIYDMAYVGKVTAVENLVRENEALKTQRDNNERMLIHWAALGGHNELVKFFLALGVPVDPQDDTNMTPLILAASAGREEVVQTLLMEGANVNAQTIDGHSALQYAASKNWHSICTKLIENNANVNIADNRGATALHRAASKGNINIVKFLLAQENCLKIDQTDIYGNTALHLACEEDREEVIKLLVSKGANPELMNKEEKTPLDLATPALARWIVKITKKPD